MEFLAFNGRHYIQASTLKTRKLSGDLNGDFRLTGLVLILFLSNESKVKDQKYGKVYTFSHKTLSHEKYLPTKAFNISRYFKEI